MGIIKRIAKRRLQSRPDDGKIRITVYEQDPAEIIVNGITYVPKADAEAAKAEGR